MRLVQKNKDLIKKGKVWFPVVKDACIFFIVLYFCMLAADFEIAVLFF